MPFTRMEMGSAGSCRVRLSSALAVLGCLLVGSASADPVSIRVHGGAARPFFDEADIRMVSEDLAVRILPGKAVVKAEFTFLNEGHGKEALVGFPQIRYHQTPTAKLVDMTFVVDGQPVPVSLLDPEPAPIEGLAPPLPKINSWYVARIWFKHGQKVQLTISYSHEHGGGIEGPFFAYLLGTAAGWKGNVDEINVRVTLGEGVPDFRRKGTGPRPYRYDKARRTLEWQFRDYAGTPGTFFVGWQRSTKRSSTQH